MAPRRLQKVDERFRSGFLRESLEELKRVYDPKMPGDRVLMAELLIETEGQEQTRTLVGELLESSKVDPSLRSRAFLALGTALRRENRLPDGLQNFERAVHFARKSGDVGLLCRTQLLLMTAKFDLFGPAALGTLPAEVWRAARAAGDAHLLAMVHCRVGAMEGRRGAFDLARRHLDLAMERLGDTRNPYVEGHIRNIYCTVAALAADPVSALKEGERTLALSMRCGDRFLEIGAVNNLCHISIRLGRMEDAERYLETAEQLARNQPFLKLCVFESRAQIQLHSGRLDECETTLAALMSLCDDVDVSQRSYAALEAAATHAQLLRRQRRFEAALDVARSGANASRERHIPLLDVVFSLHCADALIDLERFEEAATAISQAANTLRLLSADSLTVQAELERVRGKALAKLGDVDAARARFGMAIRLHEATGQVLARDEAVRCREIAINDTTRSSVGEATSGPDSRKMISPRRSTSSGLSEIEVAASLLSIANRADLLAVAAYEMITRFEADASAVLFARNTRDASLSRLIRRQNWPNAAGMIDGSDNLGTDNTIEIDLGVYQNEAFRLLVKTNQEISKNSRLTAVEALVRVAINKEEDRRERLERTSVWPTDTETDTEQAGNLMGSPRMREIYREVKKVAPSDLTILLTGETGVGKEILAREIHRLSSRSQRDFRPLVCAGIASSVLESQLFGYRKGSFTGASFDFPGVIRGAQGGTLFLDEIGELTSDLQIKLLRFLDAKEVHPLGELSPSKVDVRIIAATNANLQMFVEEKKFREDLLYRLSVATFHIPPLRERREEIPSLVQRFLSHYAQQIQRPAPKVSDEALEHLLLYRWPGNVRQLRNEMERLAGIVEAGGTIRVGDLKPEIISPSMRHAQSAAALAANQVMVCTDQPLHKAIEQLEAVMIQRALNGHTGNLENAARALGVTRKGLYHKRQRLGLL
jgi:transcriptional regulator with PAS, ATPase and Fis domain